MLLPHYVQYMALVWLLHRRKFGNAKRRGPGGIAQDQRKAGSADPRAARGRNGLLLMKDFF
jgi:hypothetical protein